MYKNCTVYKIEHKTTGGHGTLCGTCVDLTPLLLPLVESLSLLLHIILLRDRTDFVFQDWVLTGHEKRVSTLRHTNKILGQNPLLNFLKSQNLFSWRQWGKITLTLSHKHTINYFCKNILKLTGWLTQLPLPFPFIPHMSNKRTNSYNSTWVHLLI